MIHFFCQFFNVKRIRKRGNRVKVIGINGSPHFNSSVFKHKAGAAVTAVRRAWLLKKINA